MGGTRKTLLVIALLLALGLVMVLAMNMIVSMETGTVAVALLVPLLAYLLLSGAIAEFGFGGVNAKFNRAAGAVMPCPTPEKCFLPLRTSMKLDRKAASPWNRCWSTKSLQEKPLLHLAVATGETEWDEDDPCESKAKSGERQNECSRAKPVAVQAANVAGGGGIDFVWLAAHACDLAGNSWLAQRGIRNSGAVRDSSAE